MILFDFLDAIVHMIGEPLGKPDGICLYAFSL